MVKIVAAFVLVKLPYFFDLKHLIDYEVDVQVKRAISLTVTVARVTQGRIIFVRKNWEGVLDQVPSLISISLIEIVSFEISISLVDLQAYRENEQMAIDYTPVSGVIVYLDVPVYLGTAVGVIIEIKLDKSK